jgi:hypothetical protein
MAAFVRRWGIESPDEREAIASFLDGSLPVTDARSSDVKLRALREAIATIHTYERITGQTIPRKDVYDMLDRRFGYQAGTARRLATRHRLMAVDATGK